MRLQPRPALALQASLLISFLACASAPTPLYALYQRLWGFSPVTVTLIFGVYSLAVLASLLVFGRVSDHVGRRPVLVATTFAQAAVMLVFASAQDTAMLFAARILQGLVVGAAA